MKGIACGVGMGSGGMPHKKTFLKDFLKLNLIVVSKKYLFLSTKLDYCIR